MKKEGELYIVEVERGVLVPIVRTREELFSDTVLKAQKSFDLDVCINGVWYDVPRLLDRLDLVDGDDPVPASATVNEGEALLANGARFGTPEKDLFYGAQKKDFTWTFGKGNLPQTGFSTGMSGLCPLIINGLKYGVGNKYSKGVPGGAPLTGEPGKKHAPYLIQRNDNRYASLNNHKYGSGVGKAGFGVTKSGTVYVIVQAHRSPGVTFDQFRDKFIALGCHNALACDGSDSVFMYYKNRDKKDPSKTSKTKKDPSETKNPFIVNDAILTDHNKIESMTMGIGFKSR
jgi:hypothetical protein